MNIFHIYLVESADQSIEEDLLGDWQLDLGKYLTIYLFFCQVNEITFFCFISFSSSQYFLPRLSIPTLLWNYNLQSLNIIKLNKVFVIFAEGIELIKWNNNLSRNLLQYSKQLREDMSRMEGSRTGGAGPTRLWLSSLYNRLEELYSETEKSRLAVLGKRSILWVYIS